jgi:hypothetical protein
MAKAIINTVPFILVAFLAAGCAPLQQAPLVYSSKVAIGVDVSATATEQPGASITIGYKQIDAAYVPVAVAKQCEAAPNRGDCTHSIYELRNISGANDVGDSGMPQKMLDDAKQRLNDFKKVSQEKEDAAKEVLKAEAIQKEMRDDRDAFYLANQVALAKKADELKTEAEVKIPEIRKQKEDAVAKADAAVAQAKARQKKAEEDFNKNFDIAKLTEDLRLVSSSNKKADAYSVFGSFDANTTTGAAVGTGGAPKVEAGLVIGKVFSTGIASQNLTEGMRRYHEGLGNAQSAKSVLSACVFFLDEYKKTLNMTLDADKEKYNAFAQKTMEGCAAQYAHPHVKNAGK